MRGDSHVDMNLHVERRDLQSALEAWRERLEFSQKLGLRSNDSVLVDVNHPFVEQPAPHVNTARRDSIQQLLSTLSKFRFDGGGRGCLLRRDQRGGHHQRQDRSLQHLDPEGLMFLDRGLRRDPASSTTISPYYCGETTWPVVLGHRRTFLMVPVGSGGLDCYTDLISREAATDFRPPAAADSRVAESRDDDRSRLRTHSRDRAPGLGIVACWARCR